MKLKQNLKKIKTMGLTNPDMLFHTKTVLLNIPRRFNRENLHKITTTRVLELLYS